jgi:aspartate/methionine/tyrosine aminotransferase
MFCELIKDSLCSHCEFGPNKLGFVVAFLTVSVADYRFWPLCPVPRLSGFALDVPGIVKAVQEHRPKLVFLTSPNNPDGW